MGVIVCIKTQLKDVCKIKPKAKTTENIFDDTAIIVSDGCCVQLANNPALDDVTFEIKK